MEMRHELRKFAIIRSAQERARPSGNHGRLFHRRKMQGKGHVHRDALETYARLRTAQDAARPVSGHDGLFFHRPTEV